MSVSNLTNTKWRLNDTLNFTNTSTQTFSIDFWNAGGVGDWFSQLRLYYYGGSELEYHNRLDYYRKSSADWSAVYGYTPQWRHEQDKTIFIRGGSSATNSTLIAWLEANATQIELDINDLTNTVWKFNDGVSIPYLVYIPSIGEYGSEVFNLNFTSNNEQFASLSWWNDSDFYAMLMDFGDENVVATDGEFYDESYQTIEITGGSDATNPFLINFLLMNAEQVVPTPTKTFDLSTLQLSAGTHEIKVKARASGYRDSNFSNSVNYNVIAPVGGTVVLTITEDEIRYKSYFRVYDGQDDTGTLLFESTGQVATPSPQTLNCQSGYLYFDLSGGLVAIFGGITTTGGVEVLPHDYDDEFVCVVNSNGTIAIDDLHWDD